MIRKGPSMPLFMDVHQIASGVAMDDVARAHLADLQIQAVHNVRYLQYWVDAYKAQGLRNVLANMHITKSELAKVTRDRWYHAVTMRVWGRGKDYVGAGPDTTNSLHEPGANTWIPHRINPEPHATTPGATWAAASAAPCASPSPAIPRRWDTAIATPAGPGARRRSTPSRCGRRRRCR